MKMLTFLILTKDMSKCYVKTENSYKYDFCV